MTLRSKLERDVERYNAREGNLKGYDCPICKNKGYIDTIVYHKDLGYNERMTRRCECMKIREVRAMASSQLGEYGKKTMDDFIAKDEWQKAIKQKALAYIRENGSKWFVICGQSGSGKTLICSIVANYLVNHWNRNILKIVWPDFIGNLKRDTMNGGIPKNASRALEEMKKAEVLFIDEALKKFNDTDLKYFAEIINYRYANDKPTIINSENTAGDLLRADESVFSRVVEKADVYFFNIAKDVNKNYRLRKHLGERNELQ